MEYLRVKPTSDQIRNSLPKCDILVANELYTLTQAKNYKWSEDFISNHFNRINLSSKRTYYFFGARFEKQLS